MAYSLSSGDSSPVSDIEVSSNNLRSIGADLSLDDFNEEDLSEITEETTLHHSHTNKRFKSHKIKMSPSQISEHMKKISPDMIQLDFCKNDPCDYNTITEETDNNIDSKISPARPQTLNLFSEPTELNRCGRTSKVERRIQLHGNVSHSKSQDALQSKRTGNKIDDDLCPNDFKKNNQPRNMKTSISQIVLDDSHMSDSESDIYLTRSASEWSIDDPESIEYCYFDGEMKGQTHVATFKFVPRHTDELSFEMNDPIHVEVQAEDLWYEGLNMRTGEKGIFPCYYVQAVSDYLDEFSVCNKDEISEKFFLYFIGSVEVPCHKGNDVICQAMHKVAEARRSTLHSSPPAYVCLMIGSHGVKMIDQSELKKYKASRSSTKNRGRLFSSSYKVKQQTHFFQLKNVSFCGYHPRNHKYFAFITRHPSQARFACHTFVSESSTRPIIECFGQAFTQYFREYMDYVHPIEEIYME